MIGIILAAGQGTRLAPLTDSRPKCMVEYNGKPIIDYILDSMESCGVDRRVVVNGYKKDVLSEYLSEREVSFYTNNDFSTTNMVSTLFAAEKEFIDDVVISYADIIYTDDVLQALLNSNANISCIVDKDWKKLWAMRMENPLDDAETMKLDSSGNILELGKKAASYEQIDAQYIGLIKFSKRAIAEAKEFYYSLDKEANYDGKDFNNMYMTSFLQQIIDQLMPIKSVPINGGWLEIDSVDDLNAYENLNLFELK